MKKLLVASSALVAAAPAFANDVTLTGEFDFDYVTGDLTANPLATPSTSNMFNNIIAAGNSPSDSPKQRSASVGLLNGGDGDINTFSLFLTWDGGDNGGVITWTTITTSTGNPLNTAGYNVYANTQFGKFEIISNNARTTDEDLAETLFAVDETFVGSHDFLSATGHDYTSHGLVKGGFGNLGVADGPVDDLPDITRSIGNPGFRYTTPELVPGLTVALAWGGQSDTLKTGSALNKVGAVVGDLYVDQGEDYMLSIAYDNGMVDANLDYNGNGDVRLDAQIETDFGNFKIEYGYGLDVIANTVAGVSAKNSEAGSVTTAIGDIFTVKGGLITAVNTANNGTSLEDTVATGLVADNNNYELRYDAPTIAGISGVLYYNSDGTAEVQGSYDFGEASLTLGYTDFGDDAAILIPAMNGASVLSSLTNVNAYFATGARWVPARILGSVTGAMVKVETEAAGFPIALIYEDIDTGVRLDPEADISIEAAVNDYLTVIVREDEVKFEVAGSF
jgi:hypothetical protein